MYIHNPAQTHCIAITIQGGGSYQTVIHDSRRAAIGRAFGELREAGLTGEKVVFCRPVKEMSEEDRWHWGVQTQADEDRLARTNYENRTPWSMLDQF